MLAERVEIITDGNVNSLMREVQKRIKLANSKQYHVVQATCQLYKTGDASRHIEYMIRYQKGEVSRENRISFFCGGSSTKIEKEMNLEINKKNEEGFSIVTVTQKMYPSGDFKYNVYSIVFEK